MSNPRSGALASRTAPWARGAGWLMDGVRAFAADSAVWIGIGVLLLAGSLLLQIGLPVIGTLIVFLLSPMLVGGLMLALAERGNGRALQLRDLLRAFSGPHLAALAAVGGISLLLNVLAFVCMLVFVDRVAGLQTLTQLAQNTDMLRSAMDLTYALGLLVGLLVYVALLVPITMLVWFAPALVVLEGEGALAAMKHSFVGCSRNLGPYVVYGLLGLLLLPLLLVLPVVVIAVTGSPSLWPVLLASLASLLLAFLVAVPVGLASIHSAYRDIFHRA
jgi:hypothetical protein